MAKKKEEEGELIEMRCRTCGTFLGVRRRQGPFVFWCSDPCSDTLMAKLDKDVLLDEVATELYFAGVPLMQISRFTETGYTRIQQLLLRRGVLTYNSRAS